MRASGIVSEVLGRMQERLAAPETLASLGIVLADLVKAGSRGRTIDEIGALPGRTLFALAVLGMVNVVERDRPEHVRLVADVLAQKGTAPARVRAH